MMISAVKSAFRTRPGKRNLLLMVLCMLILFLFSYIDVGKITYLLFMIPACGVAFFGDQFVRIATAFMQQELDRKDGKKKY